MSTLMRVLLCLVTCCELILCEAICVRVLDRAGLPLTNAQVVAQNINKSKVLIADRNISKPKDGRYCFVADSSEYVKINISVEGFISSTLENVKVLSKKNRSFTMVMEFQEGQFDEYK